MAIKPTNQGNHTSNIKPAKQAEQPKPVAKKPDPKPEVKKSAVNLSEEAKQGQKGNAKHLGALMDTFKDDPKKGDVKDAPKDPKDPKAGDKKDPKDAKVDKKEVQQKLDKLQQELKDAQKRGDKDAIARLTGEIAGLQKQLQGDNPPETNNGDKNNDTPPVNNNGGNNAAPAGGNNGGGAPAGGGGAPAGGGGAPAGGGGAPAGGAPGGGAPAGGANEAGAGQGAGAGKEEVDQFIQFAAQSYGADPKVLSEIARRESNFNTGDVANNWDSNAKKGTPSKGMFQFIEPTFKSMMPQAKAANPGAWQGVSENWTDWKAQALTTAWAITHDKGSHWSTYQAALNTARGGGGTQTA